MKKIISLLFILLILPVATASLSETFEGRVDDLNAQAGPYLSKASLALPVDLQVEDTDSRESIVIQANKEGIVILNEVEKPDVFIRGTTEQLDTFNKDYMPVDEFLAAFDSLELEGNTIKGKLALKVANNIIEDKVAEIKAREAAEARAAARAANPGTSQPRTTEQPKVERQNVFKLMWSWIANFFKNLF